ncbi:LysR substrate-binding domain-containing protein [Labrys portucalensis]|uniref:LysR substrate-binding domain-containing protein n=1 Tax=Labrys neptuniae TaxID=376174 RepID=A0ABV6ZPD5_9HYPH
MHDRRSTVFLERWRSGQNSIDLRQLRYIILAAKHHSFRRAAASLNIQPSAISRRIRDLEFRLGTALFIRSSTGVEITKQGREFLERAQPVLEELDAATMAISTEACETLRIGISPATNPRLLHILLDTLGSQYPAIQEALFESEEEENMALVLRGRLDVAIAAAKSPPSHYHSIPLWHEDVFVIVPADHRLATLPSIGIADLLQYSLSISKDEPASQIIDALRWRDREAATPIPIEVCDQGRLALLSQIALGRRLGLCGEAATAMSFPGLTFRPIAKLFCPLTFSAICLSDNNKPALRNFLQIARSLTFVRQASYGRPPLAPLGCFDAGTHGRT